MQLVFKFFGAVIVIASCSLIGYKKGKQYVIRMQIIEDVVLILRSLKNNILYRKDTTAKAICDAFNNSTIKYVKINLSKEDSTLFPKELNKALKAEENYLIQYLDKQEIEVFYNTLCNMGGSGANEEIEKLNFTIVSFEGILNLATKEAKIQMKLYKSLGICAGVGAVLFFI